MLDLNEIVQKLAIWALPVLFAITLHEVAHGWAAKVLGDSTAAFQGRLSLNPLKHIDPVGTLLVPALALVLGGFLFGWARPVPVDYRNLKNPKKDMALVAIAGPAANFAMALAWGLLLRGTAGMPEDDGLWVGIHSMCIAGISINLGLMVLNLFPLPPLDGGRVLIGVLPMRAAYRLAQLEPWGMTILIVLMVTGALGFVLAGPYAASQMLLLNLIGLR